MKDIKLKCGSQGCDYVSEEVSAEIAWELLEFQRQNNHVQQGVGGGEGHQPRPAASGKSLKKPDTLAWTWTLIKGSWGSSRTAGSGTKG